MSDPSTTVPTQRIPQYAKSATPDVLAAIERNLDATWTFKTAALAFSAEHGDDPNHGFYVGGWGLNRHVTAIASSTRPTNGQWKNGIRGRGWAPYKSNPLSKVMGAIRLVSEPIPGLAESYAGETNADWSTPVYFPTVFVQDGVAYMGLAGLPVARNDEQPFGSDTFDRDLWTEVLGSEYLAAKERRDAAAVAR